MRVVPLWGARVGAEHGNCEKAVVENGEQVYREIVVWLSDSADVGAVNCMFGSHQNSYWNLVPKQTKKKKLKKKKKKPNRQYDGIWGGAFGKWVDHKGRAFMNEIVV